MKKLFVFLCAGFICTIAFAQTISIDWKVDGRTYAQNTCEYGGMLSVPNPPPTKYGYTFQGWIQYTQLEYIESTGTQYIDTIITPDLDYTYNITFKATDSGWLFGSTVFSAGNHSDFGVSATGIRFGNKYVTLDFVPMGKVSVSVNKTGYDINGVHTDWAGTATMSATSPIRLFWAVNSAASKTGRIYSFSITDANGDYVVNLVPVKRLSDNKFGMYDLVSHAFFANAGTGDFIAGPVVE